jgi:hypothetical protein
MSTNDPNSSSPSEIKQKQLSSALTIAVLMRGTVRCMTVRQLYPQKIQTLSIFVHACNDGAFRVTLTLLAEAQTRTLVFCIMRIHISVAMRSRRTRTWWIGRGINRGSAELESGATVYLYSMQAFALATYVHYNAS